MTRILRAALLVGLASPIIPAAAAGQDTSTASLVQRIEILERATIDLERRVGELESIIKSGPSLTQPTPTSDKWRDLANWRRLRRGMKMDEVRALLGEPARVSAGPMTSWYWPGCTVYFNGEKVEGWLEPKQ